MLRKMLKLIMTMFIILGVALSIINFVSVETKANKHNSNTGSKVYGECFPPGSDCETLLVSDNYYPADKSEDDR